MQLVLRTRPDGDRLELKKAKVLSRGSRKLVILAPGEGRWMFYLTAPDVSGVRYNRGPAPACCPVAVGDLLDLDGLELVVESVEAPAGEPRGRPLAETRVESIRSADTAEMPAAAAPAADEDVYRRARDLCGRLRAVVRGEAPPRGRVRGWLKLLRRPRGPGDALDRLETLLAGAPHDRVWLKELARFLYRQGYVGLCLPVLEDLCRLYPRDADLARTLAKFCYQQGCRGRLPRRGRLQALERAAKAATAALDLGPNDSALAELHQAVLAEQARLHAEGVG